MRRRNLRKWMLDNRVTNLDIVRKADVSTALVSLFIKGARTSGEKAERVYSAFRSLGCPFELLESGIKRKPAKKSKSSSTGKTWNQHTAPRN